MSDVPVNSQPLCEAKGCPVKPGEFLPPGMVARLIQDIDATGTRDSAHNCFVLPERQTLQDPHAEKQMSAVEKALRIKRAPDP